MSSSTAIPIDIEPYSPEDRAEAVGLLNLALGERAGFVRDVAYWDWKHQHNPAGPSLILTARAEGRLVGLRPLLRWRFLWRGGVVEAAKPVDSVTHPDFQRKGIFSRLTTAAVDLAASNGIQFLFNTPNASSRPGYLKLGWRNAASLPVGLKIVRPAAVCAGLARWKSGFAVSHDEPEFFHSQPPGAADLLRDKNAIEDLLQRCRRADDRLRPMRTLNWLDWRYGQPSHVRYYCETVEQAGRLDGIVFYRVGVRRGLREALIGDVLAPGNSGDVFEKLLQQINARLRVDYLASHIPTEPAEARRWTSQGYRTLFVPKVNLLARSLSASDGLDVTEACLWALTLGDLEGL